MDGVDVGVGARDGDEICELSTADCFYGVVASVQRVRGASVRHDRSVCTKEAGSDCCRRSSTRAKVV